jgi:protein-tyrosine-phosphatase
MRELGLDISKHRSRDIISSADLDYDSVVAMTPYVASRLKAVPGFPTQKLIVWNVPDPYGGTLEDYRTCAKIVAKLIRDLSAYIHQQERE